MDKCPECGHDKDEHRKSEGGCIRCARNAEWDWNVVICHRIYLDDTKESK